LQAPAAIVVEGYGAVGNFDAELRTGRRFFDERDRAAMSKDEFTGDRQAKAGAARAGRTAEGRKQVLPRLCGMPGPVSSTVMLTTLPIRCAETVIRLTPPGSASPKATSA
jgi:hypothetical protein